MIEENIAFLVTKVNSLEEKIDVLLHKIQSTNEPRRKMTVRQVSEEYNVDERTIRSYISDVRDPLPSFKKKGKVLLYADEVEAWWTVNHTTRCQH